MLRQASSRNQRSKGFKVKHALQIGLLVAICIWLLYQVKHSHEKKRAFEERGSKFLNKVAENQADFFKFGRKDLPHIEETGSVTETHNKEEENEETQGEEEHDSKHEEIEDEEGRGAGDDEIDEQDQGRGDKEAENGEESTEGVDVFDKQEHESSTQEAREENYKRDDASSAVVHDTYVTGSKSTGGARHADEEQGNTDEEQVVDNVDDESSANGSKGDGDANTDGSKSEVVEGNSEKKVVESENMTNGTDDGSGGDNDLSAGSGGVFVSIVSDTVLKYNETIQTDNLPSNTTAADNKNVEVDNKEVEVEFSKPDNETVSNSTTVEYNSQMEQQTNLTTEAVPNTQMELQTNSTGGVSDQQTEMQNNSTVVDVAGISASTDNVNLDSAQNQNVAADNATVGEDVHDSQFAVDVTSAMNENGDAAQGESDNSLHAAVITEEEKDARTDLSTLPEIQNEVKTTDDEAAE